MNNALTYTVEIATSTARRVLASTADENHAEGIYSDVLAALEPGEDLYLLADDGSTLASANCNRAGEVTECRAG